MNLTAKLAEIKERLAKAPHGPYQRNIDFTTYTSDILLLVKALERADAALAHLETCVERDDDHHTAQTSNFHRLRDARRTAERARAECALIICEGSNDPARD